MQRWLVKYLVATAGIMGLYLGASLGVLILARHPESSGGTLDVFTVSFFALIGGWLLIVPVERWIGTDAKHVDLLKIPLYWAAAALALHLAELFSESALGLVIPAFIDHLVLWSAGVWAVWREEPGGVSWERELAALKGLRRR